MSGTDGDDASDLLKEELTDGGEFEEFGRKFVFECMLIWKSY